MRGFQKVSINANFPLFFAHRMATNQSKILKSITQSMQNYLLNEISHKEKSLFFVFLFRGQFTHRKSKEKEKKR